MKHTSQKILFTLLLVALLSVIGYLSYNGFQAYKELQSHKTSLQNFRILSQGEKLLDALMIERLASAEVLGGAQKKASEIQELRGRTDRAIGRFADVVAETGSDYGVSQLLGRMADALKNLRSEVDAATGEYRDVLIAQYRTKILDPLLTFMREISSKSGIPGTWEKPLAYIDRLRTHLVGADDEHVFLGYILTAAKAMQNGDLAAWDRMISDDALPRADAELKRKFETALEGLPDSRNFAHMLDGLREEVLGGVVDGTYPLSPDAWEQASGKRLKILSGAIGKLSSEIDHRITKQIGEARAEWIRYAVATLFSLLLLLVLSAIFYNMFKESKLLEDALKDIEFELSPERKSELHRIVAKRDMEGVYRFLAESIKEANQAKDLFLANMSHEIRTPLNGIVGFTQLLKNTPLSSDQSEFISVIESSSENLLSIVNDILDLSKINADKIELEQIEFDPLEKFEDALESYGARAAQKDIEYSVFVDPALPKTVLGDPTKISQILVNLVSNAIKFTGTHGNVDVTVEKVAEDDENASIHFSVKDSGIGISPEQKEKIFEAFSQADAGTSRKYGGTGLGLAISSRLVELMGGKLDIESELGEGATFFFTLTLPKGEEPGREVPDYSGMHTALLLPEEGIVRRSDHNLRQFVTHCGGAFEIIQYNEALGGKKELPEILFIDHRYMRRTGELEQFMELGCKIILLTTGEMKKKLQSSSEKMAAIIYKPLNYSKTVRALDQARSDQGTGIREQEGRHRSFANLKILVAEDNPINQKLIRTMLGQFGVDVTLAANGKEALDLRKQNEYDLIFMDVQMPEMDGIEATKEILNYEKVNHLHHIPIVALTANALSGDREKYLRVGMDNYLSKPIDLEALRKLIASYFPDRYQTVEEGKTPAAESKPSVASREQRPASRPAVGSGVPESGPRQEASAAAGEEEAEKKSDALAILLYNRTRLLSRLYKGLLSHYGFEVTVAGTEDELIDYLSEGRFDYMLFDEGIFGDQEQRIIATLKETGVEPYELIRAEDEGTWYAPTIVIGRFIEELPRKLRPNQK